jgi:hypothetical protein
MVGSMPSTVAGSEESAKQHRDAHLLAVAGKEFTRSE